MPKPEDFMLTDEYDPGEAWYSKTAQDLYERVEEAWQEDYASTLADPDEANAMDYYHGLYLFIDDLAWRMKTAAMRSLHRGEWKVRGGE